MGLQCHSYRTNRLHTQHGGGRRRRRRRRGGYLWMKMCCCTPLERETCGLSDSLILPLFPLSSGSLCRCACGTPRGMPRVLGIPQMPRAQVLTEPARQVEDTCCCTGKGLFGASPKSRWIQTSKMFRILAWTPFKVYLILIFFKIKGAEIVYNH